MENRYTSTYTIRFRDVDDTKYMTTNALVDYMQEIAGEHAASLGLDLFAEESEMFWIISRAKVYLEKRPMLGEKLTLVTYPAGIDKLFLVRKTEIYNEQGEYIGYTIGDYVLIDVESKMPMRPNDLPKPFEPFLSKCEEEKLGKIKNIETTICEDYRKVRYSEIDVNNHMNNAHYVRWALDMMSGEEMKNRQVLSVQTNYLQPLVEGDEVKIIRGLDQDGNTVIIGKSLDEKKVHWNSLIVFKDIEG